MMTSKVIAYGRADSLSATGTKSDFIEPVEFMVPGSRSIIRRQGSISRKLYEDKFRVYEVCAIFTEGEPCGKGSGLLNRTTERLGGFDSHIFGHIRMTL